MNENVKFDGYLAGYMNKSADSYFGYSDPSFSKKRPNAAKPPMAGKQVEKDEAFSREVLRQVPKTRAAIKETDKLREKNNAKLEDTYRNAARVQRAGLDQKAQGRSWLARKLPAFIPTFGESLATQQADKDHPITKRKFLRNQMRDVEDAYKKYRWFLMPPGVKKKYQHLLFGADKVQADFDRNWKVSDDALDAYQGKMETPEHWGETPAERAPSIRREMLEEGYDPEQIKKLKKLQDNHLLMSSKQNQRRGQAYA